MNKLLLNFTTNIKNALLNKKYYTNVLGNKLIEKLLIILEKDQIIKNSKIINSLSASKVVHYIIYFNFFKLIKSLNKIKNIQYITKKTIYPTLKINELQKNINMDEKYYIISTSQGLHSSLSLSNLYLGGKKLFLFNLNKN